MTIVYLSVFSLLFTDMYVLIQETVHVTDGRGWEISKCPGRLLNPLENLINKADLFDDERERSDEELKLDKIMRNEN